MGIAISTTLQAWCACLCGEPRAETHSHFPFASFIVVPNTLTALQQVAGWHRAKLTMPVIGVTGSNGKTTFKELLYQLLSHRFLRWVVRPKLQLRHWRATRCGA